MEREFVSYNEALDLKELGFDEICLGSFTLSKKKLQLLHYDNEMSLVQAPLYQQAFKFFREKYDLDSFIKHLYKSTIKVGYYFGIDEYEGIEFQMNLDDYYKTHKEAELECLKKLIEIVKNK